MNKRWVKGISYQKKTMPKIPNCGVNHYPIIWTVSHISGFKSALKGIFHASQKHDIFLRRRRSLEIIIVACASIMIDAELRFRKEKYCFPPLSPAAAKSLSWYSSWILNWCRSDKKCLICRGLQCCQNIPTWTTLTLSGPPYPF